MRKSIAIATTMIVIGLTSAASAHDHAASSRDHATSSRDHEQACRSNQDAAPLSSEQFQRKVDDLGYSIQRMETERGCIEARLVEKSTGKRVKALFNAVTGELVRARPAS